MLPPIKLKTGLDSWREACGLKEAEAKAICNEIQSRAEVYLLANRESHQLHCNDFLAAMLNGSSFRDVETYAFAFGFAEHIHQLWHEAKE